MTPPASPAGAHGEGPKTDEWRAPFTAPTISVPTGGGAIRGVGEKFAANPVTGSATFSIPLPASPGRSGFGPHLALRYDSASGNGSFGFGWSLALPAITRKTDKGLPRYRDDTDTFLMSDAEDLVPVLNPAGTVDDDSSVPGYVIRRFRPRIEGLFARIERWTRTDGDVHWRSISVDNVLTVFGKDRTSRVVDPANGAHIFSWLICESRDDKGNAVVYEYRAEDGTDVALDRAHERQRGGANDPSRTANRYVERIRYGNATTLLDAATARRPALLTPQVVASTRWMFELVFDYGDPPIADPDAVGTWTCRADPFSRHRAGFEVRTYRLCHRVLMFHRFPDLDGDVPCLVRSLDLTYRSAPQYSTSSDTGYSFVQSATQWSYQRDGGAWHRRQLPPIEFSYSEATIDDHVRDVQPRALENLPVGLGSGYQWVDLDGEGVCGILTEQAGAWYYKPNLGSNLPGGPTGPGFGPARPVNPQPAMAALGAGRQQLMDVEGNGALDLVELHPPLAGFHERDEHRGWTQFVPFSSLPTIDWDDRNLRFLDLTGDGHADAVITEADVFTWYPSLAHEGFGAPVSAASPRDERDGPRLIFADAELTVYLADMSGDGLIDIVRIRNGQICYWPNLGYSRWGKQVVMDDSPWFEHGDLFDQRRIRLADIDGSGTTDLIYLSRDGARLWFNRSGNAWSPARDLPFPAATTNVAQIRVADLLGNGTACLVWSSDLPADAGRPLRYLDLMGGHKPHLLIEIRNNLGAVTTLDYAASTKFSLRDKAAGTPWATKLPFPVHCLEKVTVTDLHRRSVFANTFSYHHGYFDGVEREFRGFGRVEQVDTQRFDDVSAANRDTLFVGADHSLYQPPVKTVTWFHTGIAASRARILGLYEREYFPSRYADRLPAAGFAEHDLPQPVIEASEPGLATDEWREAMRACKGMMLRQEIVELDALALHDRGEQTPVRLFTAAQHNCHVRRVQPRGINQHAVFVVTESEAVSYHYELALTGAGALQPDPRIAHTLNLRFDSYGRAVQSVAAAYPRELVYSNPEHDPAPLATQQVELIRAVQRESHLAYTETLFTGELPIADRTDNHRLPAPCEVRTYELTDVDVPPGTRYYTRDGLRAFALNPALDTQATRTVTALAYQQQPPDRAAHKRLIEHTLTRYRRDDLSGPLGAGQLSRLGLAYETYRLALTDSLLADVLTGTPVSDDLVAEARSTLGTSAARPGFFVSGYLDGAALFEAAGAEQTWWLRSGAAGFQPDAAAHFYLPERFLNSFGNETTLAYDADDLYVASSTDPVGNTTSVDRFDHRVLAPARLTDANANITEVAFDVRGLPVASATMGKLTNGVPQTGDTVTTLSFRDLNPNPGAVAQFFHAQPLDEVQARAWLGRATTRFVYHLGERHTAGVAEWAVTAAGSCGIVREHHERDAPNATVDLQLGFEYSDGAGQAFVKKVQAEPDPATHGGPIRWIVNGKTVVNNKGKPVLQYEPYFSPSGHLFEEPTQVGVSPVLLYDAPGRLIRTDLPDGTHSRVEFTPWLHRSFDQNDTVRESRWYRERGSPDPAVALTRDIAGQLTVTPDYRAAWLAAHHANTPAETHLDSLGRDVITIAHNRQPDENAVPAINWSVSDWGWQDERVLTFTKLDAEGKPLWICDARGNLVMQYIAAPKADHTPLYDGPAADHRPAYDMPAASAPCYDIAGNLLYQHSVDAGDRRLLTDATGQPMLAWDYNERMDATSTVVVREHRLYETRYDALHRPIERRLRIRDDATGDVNTSLIERLRYGEDRPDDTANNLRGQLWQHYDASGLTQTNALDLSGKPFAVRVRLARDIEAAVLDWTGRELADADADSAPGFDDEVFTQRVDYDALGRETRRYNWHVENPGNTGTSERVAVYLPHYNRRGALDQETLFVRARKTPGGHEQVPGVTRSKQAITGIAYNAKGQKISLELGNGTTTHYTYDPATFRLAHLYTRRASAFTTDCGSDTADLERPLRPCGVQNLHYTYDPAGNITHIQDDAQQTIFFANSVIEPSNDYVYDALYRLVEGTGRENAAAVGAPSSPEATRRYIQRYRYDRAGNIEQMRHLASSFGGRSGSWTRYHQIAYDSNRLSRTWLGDPDWTSANATGKTEYGYDPHGSMLNLGNAPTKYDLRWDWNDMIHTIDLGGGGRAWYTYGADKQRCRKRIVRNPAVPGGTMTEERIYLGGYERYRRHTGNPHNPVEEIESHQLFEGEQRVLLVDDVLKTPNPRPDGSTLRAQTLWRYQYSNHLGSVGAELDDKAQLISYEEFHPYGTSAYELIPSNLEVPRKRYRYTGIERDDESGMSYHGARYLDVLIGRWATCDPLGVADGPNRYQYAHARTVRLSDPLGTAARETEAERIGRAAQQLGAENEGLWKHFQDLVNKLRAQDVQVRPGINGPKIGLIEIPVERKVPPAMGSTREMDEIVTSVGLVREHKAMGIGSERNLSVRQRLGNLTAAQKQVAGYVSESQAAKGVVINTWYGKVTPERLGALKEEAKVLGGQTAVTSIGTLRTRIGTLEGLIGKAAKSKTVGHLASVGKHVSRPALGIITAIGLIGTAQAATRGSDALQKGDYHGAVDGLGSAGLDVVEMTPTPLGALVGAARGGYAAGEAAGEGLGINDLAQKRGKADADVALHLGTSRDAAGLIGATSASLTAVGDLLSLATNPGALTQRMSDTITSWLQQ